MDRASGKLLDDMTRNEMKEAIRLLRVDGEKAHRDGMEEAAKWIAKLPGGGSYYAAAIRRRMVGST